MLGGGVPVCVCVCVSGGGGIREWAKWSLLDCLVRKINVRINNIHNLCSELQNDSKMDHVCKGVKQLIPSNSFPECRRILWVWVYIAWHYSKLIKVAFETAIACMLLFNNTCKLKTVRSYYVIDSSKFWTIKIWCNVSWRQQHSTSSN